MSSGFLYVETQPGREAHVLGLLERFPGVTHKNVLFPAAIAVRLEANAVDHLVGELRKLEGVIGTRLYRARHT